LNIQLAYSSCCKYLLKPTLSEEISILAKFMMSFFLLEIERESLRKLKTRILK
jgi:hypothetical protein